MNLTSHHSTFEYRDRPAFKKVECVINPLHEYLYQVGARGGKLLKFNCPHPYISVHSEDVSGVSLSGYPLETWIAKWQAAILSQGGLVFPTGFVNNHRESLISLYLLNSCLCVAESKSRGLWAYSFVTKSPAVLKEHEFHMAPAYRQKWFNRFADQLSTNQKELEGGFKTVEVVLAEGGVILAKKTIKADAARYLFPYYVVENYMRGLGRVLARGKVRITYHGTDGLCPPLVTSLATEVVAHWLGVSFAAAEAVKNNEFNAPFSGYISLPDLTQPGQFVSVPVLHIEKLEFQ
ncbi:hypothetical protein V3851_25330 [Paenibacillus sp. M1]|uniref:Uncharacterized protein n=1 Tax=Paenibacillus haidiansis TaxID=1574488 RepID=A0ABU7VZB1_9BACL